MFLIYLAITMVGSDSSVLFVVFSEMLLVFGGIATVGSLSSVALYPLENQLENRSMELRMR